MKIGITGHQKLPSSQTWKWVERELKHIIAEVFTPRNTVGLSSLAIGADQLFARLLLEAGGELHVIVPFAGYEKTFDSDEDLACYEELLAEASDTEILSSLANDEQSYFAAGKFIASGCDTLVAVWNGKVAKGLGGTADVVKFAQKLGKPVIHLNTEERVVSKI